MIGVKRLISDVIGQLYLPIDGHVTKVTNEVAVTPSVMP